VLDATSSGFLSASASATMSPSGTFFLSILGGAISRVAKFDSEIKKVRQDIPGPLRELLGEVKDPIKQYMRTAAKINTYIADTNFFNTLLKVGKGKYFFEKGFQDKKKSDTYTGQVKNWLRHGKGTYTWVKQGMKYSGNWKDDKRHGYGEYKEGDSIYIGNWKDDKRWGKGKITIKKKHSISGNFRHTNLIGKVIMDFWKPILHSNLLRVDKYVGHINNETGRPNGIGFYFLENKEVATGIWKNGKLIHGKEFYGSMIRLIENGKAYNIRWKKNK